LRITGDVNYPKLVADSESFTQVTLNDIRLNELQCLYYISLLHNLKLSFPCTLTLKVPFTIVYASLMFI